MPKPQITNLSDEIMSKVIEHLGKESAWYLGPFLWTGKQAIYYEGLHRATSLGVEEGIKVLEANVPKHGLSTLADILRMPW
ncbi:unnamed protein product [Brassica oleracea]